MKKWKPGILVSFLAVASIALANPAHAAFEGRKHLTFTLGGFSLDEGEGQAVARWNEYRDIDRGGATVSLDAQQTGRNRLTWRAALKNPGYQDAEGALSLQWRALASLDFNLVKTPHYIDKTNATVRERSAVRLTVAPLSNIGGSIQYAFEEKDGSLKGNGIGQEWDRIDANVNALFRNGGVNLELTDSQMRFGKGGYDADGASLQAVGGKGRLQTVGLYKKTTYDSVLPGRLLDDVETTHAGLWGRYQWFDYFRVNASASRTETDNQNAGGIGFDSRQYKFGAEVQLSYAQLGFNYTEKDVDKANGPIRNKNYETLELYLKGRLDDRFSFRATVKSTDKSALGGTSLEIKNSNDLASKADEANLSATWRPFDNLTLTSGAIAKDENFEAVSLLSLDERSIDTRHQTALWQITDSIALGGDYLFQKLVYRGNFGGSVVGPPTSAAPFRIGQALDRYSIGLSYTSPKSFEVGVSYAQSEAEIGDFHLPNRVAERNIEGYCNHDLKGGWSVRLAVNHNTYADWQNAGASGVGDLVELEVKRTIRF